MECATAPDLEHARLPMRKLLREDERSVTSCLWPYVYPFRSRSVRIGVNSPAPHRCSRRRGVVGTVPRCGLPMARGAGADNGLETFRLKEGRLEGRSNRRAERLDRSSGCVAYALSTMLTRSTRKPCTRV